MPITDLQDREFRIEKKPGLFLMYLVKENVHEGSLEATVVKEKFRKEGGV